MTIHFQRNGRAIDKQLARKQMTITIDSQRIRKAIENNWQTIGKHPTHE